MGKYVSIIAVAVNSLWILLKYIEKLFIVTDNYIIYQLFLKYETEIINAPASLGSLLAV